MIQYQQLLIDILEDGAIKPAARENMPGTTSLFGHQFRNDLSKGFPLLTTKKLSFKNIVVELLWFLKGDTNIKFLVDNGCNIWNEDAYNFYLKQIGKNAEGNYDIKPMDFATFIERIKDNRNYEKSRIESYKYKLGDCGYQYGRVWRNWDGIPFCNEGGIGQPSVDQLGNIIRQLKRSPQSRRHVITAIDPANDQNLALFWCHALFQFNCRPIGINQRMTMLSEESLDHFHSTSMYDPVEYADSKNIPKYYLDCQMYQRSADVFLGVPYNIASYALLTHIIAKMCNMIPVDFIHTFGDVHIYDNHMDQVNEQLSRECRPLPTFKFSDDIDWSKDLDELIAEELGANDGTYISKFILEGYDPHPRIKAKLSTGLK